MRLSDDRGLTGLFQAAQWLMDEIESAKLSPVGPSFSDANNAVRRNKAGVPSGLVRRAPTTNQQPTNNHQQTGSETPSLTCERRYWTSWAWARLARR